MGSTPSCTRADSVTVVDYVFQTPNTDEALCNRDLALVHTMTDTQSGTVGTDTQSGAHNDRQHWAARGKENNL